MGLGVMVSVEWGGWVFGWRWGTELGEGWGRVNGAWEFCAGGEEAGFKVGDFFFEISLVLGVVH